MAFESFRQAFRRKLTRMFPDMEWAKEYLKCVKGRDKELLLNDIKLMESYRDSTREERKEYKEFRAIINNGEIGVHLTPTQSVQVAAPKNTNSSEAL